MAYQRWWKTVRDQQGNAVNGANCAVYNGGTGALATVYDPNTDDSAPGGLSNPFTTTANGVFGFMAADGEYDVQISGGNGATQQYRVRLDTLGQSADSLRSDLAASSGAGLVGYGAGTVEDALDTNAVDIYAARNATMTDQFSWAPPTDFIATGLTFTRNGNGNYTSSFNPDTYAASLAYTRTIYVNRATGNDATGDGTSGLPYKTPQKAFAIAQAGADTSVRVLIVTGGADVLFYRDELTWLTPIINGKKIYLTTDDNTKKAYISSAQETLAWSLTSLMTYTFQATRASTLNVVDISNKDSNGIPIPYTRQTSIAEVEALAGSWWTDGTLVYVHTLAGTTPVNGTHLVCIAATAPSFDLKNSAEVFYRNCFFIGGAQLRVRNDTSDNTSHRFTTYNCSFCGSLGPNGDGLAVDSVKSTYCFNSFFSYNGSDGFNAHYTRIGAADPRTYLAVCVGCVSYLNGTGYTLTANINNAFTSHEGASVLYVSCSGYTCNGPLFANVNGCYSVLAGCRGWGSTGSATHGAFYFDGAAGKAVLKDCIGSDPFYDLGTDGLAVVTLDDCSIGTVYTTANVSVSISSFLRKNAPVDSGVIPGYGAPEGVVTAPVGTLYRRLDGTTGKTLYIKETGSSSTGWVAK